MSSSNVFSMPSLPSLSKETYQRWKYDVTATLEYLELMDVVDGTDVKPVDVDKLAGWRKKDANARRVLAHGLSDEQHAGIRACLSANEIWLKIKSLMEKSSKTNKYLANQELHQYSFRPDMSVSTYCSGLAVISQKLQSIGVKVEEETMVAKLVNDLPEKYNTFRQTFRIQVASGTELTMAEVQEQLLLVEEDIIRMSGKEEGADSAALFHRAGSVSQNGGGNKHGGSNKKNGQFREKKGKCHFCQKEGHFIAECRKRIAEETSGQANVSRAQSDPERQGQAFAVTGVRSTNERRIEADSFRPAVEQVHGTVEMGSSGYQVCIQCTQGTQGPQGPQGPLHRLNGQAGVSLFDDETGEAWACSSTQDSWLADSGASEHMSYKRNWFTNFKSFANQEKPIYVGNNAVIYAAGRGDIKVETFVSGRWEEHIILDALFVPEIRKNLFSIGAAADKGVQARLTSDKCLLEAGGKVVAVGVRCDSKLYRLLMRTSLPEQANAVSLPTPLKVWHERFGHVNYKTLKEMVSSSSKLPAVVGLDCKKPSDTIDEFCEGCLFGKQHRGPFSESTSRAKLPGELIHFDLCGPMSTDSIGGSKYMALFKDDFTSYCLVYAIKLKSEILGTVGDVITTVKAAGHHIKRMRSDNAKEFVSAEMKALLRKHGVVSEHSAPYVPQQNGRIERQNRTIVESARSLLHAAELPLSLWAEMVHTAAYVRNRIALHRLNGLTPYEHWTGKKPNVGNLRIIGSDAYALTNEQFRTKFDPKSRKFVLVGYEAGPKAYRLWERGTRKVIVARDVVIHEKEIASAVLPLQLEEEVIKKPVHDLASGLVSKKNPRTPLTREPYETRSRKELGHDGQQTSLLVASSDPLTLQDALSSDDKKQWELAMKDELDSLVKNSTWVLKSLPNNRKAIRNKWIFKLKPSVGGNAERFKARLVVKGCSQVAGLDYGETFAPVARYDSIRMLLAMAAENDLELAQFDVKTAFLYGELDEEIYMLQPDGFEDGSGRVCLLQKSLYGLKQAPRQWNKKFDNFLKDFGLSPTNYDRCIYANEREQLYVALYVDDGLACSKSKDTIDKLLASLKSEFEITVSDAELYVGLQLDRDRIAKTIRVHQTRYAESVLARFNMMECHPAKVPADPNALLNKSQDDDAENTEETSNFPYRQIVGSLMYLMIGTRPDICFAVGKLSQFLESPTVVHWKAAKRVLRYINGTKTHGLVFGSKEVVGNNQLIAYGDADFAADEDTRKSTSGVLLLLNGAPVIWSSRKQTTVATSTTDAEYIAACEVAKEIVWARGLIGELGLKQLGPTQLFCDNMAAKMLVDNPVFHRRTKHVDIKYHFTREKAQDGTLIVKHIATDKQLADIFTKALANEKFCYFRSKLNLLPA